MTSKTGEGLHWDHSTAAAEKTPSAGDIRPSTPDSLVLSREGEILAVAPAGKEPTLVGRSSRCGLRTDDPRFPGVAGEIILHPVPLFRPWREGREEGKQVLPIKREAPLRLGAFQLRLLPAGAVLRNRRNRPSGRTRSRLVLILSVLLLAVGGYGVSPSGRRQDVPSALEVDGEDDRSPLVRADVPSLPAPSASPVDPCARTAARPFHPVSLPMPGMEGGNFSRVMDAARTALLEGDPRAAGTMLTPFLPLMSTSQRADLASILEQPAGRLFRRAYINHPYDPSATEEWFAALADSGLEDLPSTRKARQKARNRPRQENGIAN